MATDTMVANIGGPDDLQELVIWPKLFRRLAAFYQDGHTDLSELDSWLRADPRDRDDRLLLPNRELGNMHDLIIVEGNDVHLKHLPEDIVIVPDDFTLPVTPDDIDAIIHAGTGSVRIMAALINPEQSPERGNETVTILNTTNRDINLTDWSIANNKGRHALGGILARSKVKQIAMGGNVQLSNNRDTITILGPEDQIIDQVSNESRDLPDEGHTMVF